MESKEYTQKLTTILDRAVSGDKSKLLKIVENYINPSLFTNIIYEWSHGEQISWDDSNGRIEYDGRGSLTIYPFILENRTQIESKREEFNDKYGIFSDLEGNRPLFICLDGLGKSLDGQWISAPELFFDNHHTHNYVNVFEDELLLGFLEKLYGNGGIMFSTLDRGNNPLIFDGGHVYVRRKGAPQCEGLMHSYIIKMKKREEDTLKDSVEARNEILRRRNLTLRFKESELFKRLGSSPTDLINLGHLMGEILLEDKNKIYSCTAERERPENQFYFSLGLILGETQRDK